MYLSENNLHLKIGSILREHPFTLTSFIILYIIFYSWLIFVNFQNEPTVEEVKKPEPVAQNELIDSGIIQMVVEFIKNIKKKPEFLLEIVLPMVEESGLVGKEVTSMAKIYGKSFVRSESFMYLIDSTADYIESVGKSPMGK